MGQGVAIRNLPIGLRFVAIWFSVKAIKEATGFR
jgi:hypothetical protein